LDKERLFRAEWWLWCREWVFTEDVSDEEESVEAEGNVDDEDLPTWAKHSLFVDDELGEYASAQH
jgi:hypothetical protein